MIFKAMKRFNKGFTMASYGLEMWILGILIISTIFATTVQVTNLISSRAIANDYEKAVMFKNELTKPNADMGQTIADFYMSSPDSRIEILDSEERLDFDKIPCKRNSIFILSPAIVNHNWGKDIYLDKIQGTNAPTIFTPNSNYDTHHPLISVNETNKIYVLSCQNTLWASKRMFARVY